MRVPITQRIERRLKAYAYRQQRIERQINILAVFRLATFLALLLGLTMLFGKATLTIGALICVLSGGLFLYLMVRHDRCYRFKTQCSVLQEILRQDLARATYKLQDINPAHPIEFERTHPFAHDIDIAGSAGLMAVIDDTHHLKAKEWLVQWLDETPDAEVIHQRQQAVSSLAVRKRFRLKLALAARMDSPYRLDPQEFSQWLKTPNPWSVKTLPFYLCLGLTTATVTALTARFIFGAAETPWLPLMVAQILVFYGLDYINREFNFGFLDRGNALRAASAVIAPFQSLKTEAGPLKRIQQKLGSNKQDAAAQLAKLNAIHEQLSFRQNGLGHFLLNVLFSWDQIQLRRLTQWRTRNGMHLQLWLECMFEVEALSSLANVHWLYPQRPFPEIVNSKEFYIEAENLGHPSIAEQQRVGNRFQMVGGGKVHLITGSNMSGKSTFLRAIGTNQVLAKLGAPVCAESLKTSLPNLWTSIRIQDSLAEGVSYFYAEVKRLKVLMDAVEASERPVLFLLDEILKGTNSRERLVACKALVEFLIDHQASGLITTHDLELLAIEQTHPEAITKFHFQEQIHDDTMFFDYQIKPGELTSTNALRVMKYAGITLDFDSHT